jgi:DNA-binding CsgD family transcriptional regulator
VTRGVESTTPPRDNRAVAFPPHSLTPEQRGRLLDAEREGIPFVAYRDESGDLRLETLTDAERLTVGRGEQNAIAIDWDPEVSRTHAQLELVGDEWTLVDDGLSRNGSFVNGERVTGRRRLADGDVLLVGQTALLFRTPGPMMKTTVSRSPAAAVRLTEAQRRVLLELCRPLLAQGGANAPAGNREIAAELHLSLDGVKTHIRALFEKLGIEELPQYHKRVELARRAIDLGLVTQRDLG